jgi:signal transduction histidine kinase
LAGADAEPQSLIAWTPGDKLELTAYIAVAIGYLMGVLTAAHLNVLTFALLTAGNLAWLVLFRRCIAEESSERECFLAALGMCAVSLAITLSIIVGVGFDWLLPVVTIAILAMAYPPRLALPFCLVLYLGTVVPLVVADGPFGLKNAFQDQIQLAPAFAFTYIFGMVMRQQQLQRARAEALVREIEVAHDQLRAYADQVEELTITRERNRMAREIHDTLGHYLTVLAVQLETAIKLEERHDAGLHGELVEARRVASECLMEVRRSVAALRPVDLTGTSFEGALEHLVAEFQTTAPGAEVALDVEGATQALAPELRLALYRCAQEALTNIRKHAAASKVLVRVRVDDAAAELTVLDNGQGASSRADGHAPGYGLLGMTERIALLGGTARASAEPGRGWRVEVRVPLGESVPATP